MKGMIWPKTHKRNKRAIIDLPPNFWDVKFVWIGITNKFGWYIKEWDDGDCSQILSVVVPTTTNKTNISKTDKKHTI